MQPKKPSYTKNKIKILTGNSTYIEFLSIPVYWDLFFNTQKHDINILLLWSKQNLQREMYVHDNEGFF